MYKIIRLASKVVLVVAILCLFSYSVRHVSLGGSKLGVWGKMLKTFSEFPNKIEDVFRGEKKTENPRLLEINTEFKHLNELTYNVFAVNAHYDSLKWIINLINLKNDSTIFRWYIHRKDFNNSSERIFSHAEPFGPIVLKDSSIIVHNYGTHNLFRLDKNSQIIWHNTDHQFHHSVNLSSDGNIWTCTRKKVRLSNEGDISILSDYLTKIDIESGETILSKSLNSIFMNNGLSYMIHGLTNKTEYEKSTIFDPFHLNDIQPVLKNGPYWKDGDLFLSLRHRSMVLLYRPSENRIIRLIQGPFLNNHDVDIESDSTISLFNNNTSSLLLASISDLAFDEISEMNFSSLNKVSQVLIYNFKDSSFKAINQNQFVNNQIFTVTEGLHHILKNGDMFVESQNEGKVYIFNEDEVLYKRYYNLPNKDGLVERPHWVRIYENINF